MRLEVGWGRGGFRTWAGVVCGAVYENQGAAGKRQRYLALELANWAVLHQDHSIIDLVDGAGLFHSPTAVGVQMKWNGAPPRRTLSNLNKRR